MVGYEKGVSMRILLGLVFALFVGILIFVYLETKKVSPVMLDEKGQRL